MTFKQVLSFFLTGATVLSMSATALAADTASDAAEDTGANTVVDGLETALPADSVRVYFERLGDEERRLTFYLPF